MYHLYYSDDPHPPSPPTVSIIHAKMPQTTTHGTLQVTEATIYRPTM